MVVKWEKDLLFDIVKDSKSQKEVLLKLGIRNAGGNFKTLKKYLSLYKIDTSHFEKNYDKMILLKNKQPIEDILVVNSSFNRSHLKSRLYDEGIKEKKCEMCGQDENWNGKKMSLVLDHINGIHNDNRLENLRILCPNCNATTETFCKGDYKRRKFFCECGNEILKNSTKCVECTKFSNRKSDRPEYLTLLKEIENLGYASVGRKYKVSCNSIRKWVKFYEKENKNLFVDIKVSD